MKFGVEGGGEGLAWVSISENLFSSFRAINMYFL